MQEQHHPRSQIQAYPPLQRAYGSMDAAYASPIHAYSPASASTSPTAHATQSFLYSQQQQHQGVHNGLSNEQTVMHHTPINQAAPRISMGMHDQQQRQYYQQMGTNGQSNGNMNAYTHQHPQYNHQIGLPTHYVDHSHQSFRSPHENPQPSPSTHWNQAPRYPQHAAIKAHLSPLDSYLLARALQTAVPQQETQQIMLFAQSNHRNPNVFLHAYQQNKHEIDELVAQLRKEESSTNGEHSQSYGYGQAYSSGPHSSSSLNGTPAQTIVHIPPAVIPLPGAINGHGAPARPGQIHGMHSSMPTSAPGSFSSFAFQRNHSFSTDRDLPSEASSPMLETPTSASLPTSANVYKPSSAGGYMSPVVAPQQAPPPPSAPPSPTKKASTGFGGSREGEPYSEEEVRLIEEVIRDAVQKNPEIKMAQLGQLIHDRDPTRPATAWSRQLSKRKQAIDKARELSKNGKSIANFPIDANNRKGRTHTETDTDGESVSIPARSRVGEKDDDDDYDDRPTKRRRGL